MKNKKFNIIIVGSGFAGIVAAGILSNKGLSVLIVDEYSNPGGQLLRKISQTLGKNRNYRPDYIKRSGNRFLEKLKGRDIEILNNSSVIGIYDNNEILLESKNERVIRFNFDHIIFATGARERFLPFKGWTLPGVFSTGMAQVLMKSYGVLPAKKLYIYGSGLFLFSAAYELLKNGAEVGALFEMSGMRDKIRLFPSLIHAPSKVVEGVRYISKIFLSGVPVRYKRRVVEARGDGTLKEIVVAKSDNRGKIVSGSEKIIKTDSLAIGHGFSPNIELPSLAGCELEFLRELGGWIVKVNNEMETSIKQIYAAGETTGIGGALKSVNEGKIAANSILKNCGILDESIFKKKEKKLLRERRHNLEFAYLFNSLYGINKGDIEMIPDDTVICRCEDVKMSDLRKTIKEGFITPGALKISVRAGMGNCQGRTCGPLIYDLLNFSSGCEIREPFSTRPPLKPVKIANLAKE